MSHQELSIHLVLWRLGIGVGVQFFVDHQGGLKIDQFYYWLGSIFLVASHLNSSRYRLVLLTLTFPSVFWAAPEKRSNPDWDSFIVYFAWVVGEGAI